MQIDTTGPYRLVLKLVSSHTAINALARVTNHYFNFAPAQVEKITDVQARLRRPQFPAPLAPWYGPVAESYSLTALEIGGTRAATGVAGFTPIDERAHGVELTDMHLDVRWG